MRYISRILISSALIAFLTHCVAIQPFPNAVRAGDTITLAIGSLDGVSKNNITVLYYPDIDPGNPVDITTGVRSVLKIYPDKTSKSYWDTTTNSGLDTMSSLSNLSAHGPWQTVVAVDLPATLQAGTGHVKISITPGPDVRYPSVATRVENVNIAMEVLAAADGSAQLGSAHAFGYRSAEYDSSFKTGLLQDLEPLTQLVVRHGNTQGSSYPMSAAEYNINMVVVDANGIDVTDQVTNNDIAVILDDQPAYVTSQTSLIWSRSGSLVKIMILSPGKTLNGNLLRFSLLLSNLNLETTNGWTISDTSSLSSAFFYDLNGVEVPRPIPQLIVLRN